MEEIKIFEGSINSAKGFKATGVSAGIKKTDELDLALVFSDPPAKSAGIFTGNLVKGHSLVRTMALIGQKPVFALLINSGNANACLGSRGASDAQEMAQIAAEHLACSSDEILTGSTGIIGLPLPMEKIRLALPQAVKGLSHKQESGKLAAEAIMTTDTYPKQACRSFNLESGKYKVSVCGMAKGSGMIHPDMATMIAVLTSDCNISDILLDGALKEVADRSFNRISVDGDTSVCDMVLLLTNGASANPEIKNADSPEYRLFLRALEDVSLDLSKQIAADGEGATKLIEVSVLGAPTSRDALLIARSICKSPLVKTAFFGEDANWGRILTAAGYSGANFDPNLCQISLGEIMVYSEGQALVFDEQQMKQVLSRDFIKVTLDLKQGENQETMWTCDLSHDYISINSDYRS